MTPMVGERLVSGIRVCTRTYPSCSAIAYTRAIVWGEACLALPPNTLETVASDTPAFSAISLIVTRPAITGLLHTLDSFAPSDGQLTADFVPTRHVLFCAINTLPV